MTELERARAEYERLAAKMGGRQLWPDGFRLERRPDGGMRPAARLVVVELGFGMNITVGDVALLTALIATRKRLHDAERGHGPEEAA